MVGFEPLSEPSSVSSWFLPNAVLFSSVAQRMTAINMVCIKEHFNDHCFVVLLAIRPNYITPTLDG